MPHISKLIQLCLPCPKCGKAPHYINDEYFECPDGHMTAKVKARRALYSQDKREAYYERCAVASVWNKKVSVSIHRDIPTNWRTKWTLLPIPHELDVMFKLEARQCPHCSNRPALIELNGRVMIKCGVCSHADPVPTNMSVEDFMKLDFQDKENMQHVMEMLAKFWHYRLQRFPDGESSVRSYPDYWLYETTDIDASSSFWFSEETCRRHLGFDIARNYSMYD